MRVIAGSLGGRTFKSPSGHRTHPMSDKIRGAIFNMLGDIEGALVLDAFAGSGALSFEAISRGASHATAIEVDKHAHRIIQENAKTLGIENHIKAIRVNAGIWSDNNPDKTFDIILCDPPYDKPQLPIIQKLLWHIHKDGLLVLSWPGATTIPELSDTETATTKSYGDAQLAIYRKTV